METKTCKCGCRTTKTGKASYLPGHDAKHVRNLVHATLSCINNADQVLKIQQLAWDGLSPKLYKKYLDRVSTSLNANK